MRTAAALLLIMACLCSCRKEDSRVNAIPAGSLSICFHHLVGNKNLTLDAEEYATQHGEKFSVTTLQYFVSNIILSGPDSLYYQVPQDDCYFIINEANPASKTLRMAVPDGVYTHLRFLIGVDSLKSTTDISERNGVLNPLGDENLEMYRGPNSGYIFFKMEGVSPNIPADGAGKHCFRFHIGGFGGYMAPTINNIKTVTLDLRETGPALSTSGKNPVIHIAADLRQVFNGIDLQKDHDVQFNKRSTKISENYARMFRHDHTDQ